MDEPCWVSEQPYTRLRTLLENVNQLPLCMASLLTCLSLFSLSLCVWVCLYTWPCTSVWLSSCCVIFLAGLAKPMGLVEGPGGLGQGGAAATLGEDSHDAEGKYEEYGYNAQLSDRISLDRSIPDYRPKKYIHLLFLLFFLLAGLYNVTVRFASLIPAAVDGFYFCEGTQCKAGLFGQETGIFIKRTAFFHLLPLLCLLRFGWLSLWTFTVPKHSVYSKRLVRNDKLHSYSYIYQIFISNNTSSSSVSSCDPTKTYQHAFSEDALSETYWVCCVLSRCQGQVGGWIS